MKHYEHWSLVVDVNEFAADLARAAAKQMRRVNPVDYREVIRCLQDEVSMYSPSTSALINARLLPKGKK